LAAPGLVLTVIKAYDENQECDAEV